MPGVVPVTFGDRPPASLEDVRHRAGLSVPELQEQRPAGPEAGCEFVGEPSVIRDAVRAAIQGQAGVVVPHLGLECVEFRGGDVRRIGNHQVKGAVGRQFAAAVPQMEGDAGAFGQTGGVAPGEFESFGGAVHGHNAGSGGLAGDGQREAAGSGAPVEDVGLRLAGRSAVAQPVPGAFGEEFGLGTGNKGGPGNLEFKAGEGGGAEDVLKRLAKSAAAHGLTNGRKLGLVEGAVELEVQPEPGQPERVREDPLDLQARGFDAARLQVGGAAPDDLEQSHAGQVALAGPGPQT